MGEIDKKIAREFSPLKNEKGIYVAISKASKYHTTNISILKYMTKTLNMKGIYVTLNRSYDTVVKDLKKEGVDTKKMYFIDGSEQKSKEDEKIENCTFITGSRALTELSLVITTACNTKTFDFLFFDSLSTILIYNDLKTTEKFSHYLINNLKKFNISGIVVSLDEGSSKDLIPILSQFCDKSVKL